MNLSFLFKGKSVLITGGAQGIGRQIAEDFLKAGANVAVWDLTNPDIRGIHADRVDVSDLSSCRAGASRLPFAVDILVNNAGITRDKTLAKMTAEEFNAVIQVNLCGVFNVTKTLLDRFNDQSQNRRIVNISSVVALYGNFGQTNYAASKAGVIAMTKTWAKELGRKGFTVNAIAPGFVRTAMVAQMPKDIVEAMADRVNVKRLGETPDISRSVMFLASEEASYINGACLSVDGGLSL